MRNILNKVCNLWHPEIFQGINKKAKYFEGWYYKLVDRNNKDVIAIIPGLFLGTNTNLSRAFIQVFQGIKQRLDYFEYPIEQFSSKKNKFKISIGQNEFSDRQIRLSLQNEKTKISGSVVFDHLKPWPRSLFSPGAMGPYSFVPWMQCNHAVISMDHHVNGTIKIDNHILNFNQGRGYIEKDWGKGFPDAYVWLQCNHFKTQGVSLFASIAKVPWITGAFRGFIIGLHYEDKLLRFATYTSSELKYMIVKKDIVEFSVSDKYHRLLVRATRGKGVVMHGPYDMHFIQRVSETLTSEVDVTLWAKKHNTKSEKVIFAERGYPAGLDVNGKITDISYLE